MTTAAHLYRMEAFVGSAICVPDLKVKAGDATPPWATLGVERCSCRASAAAPWCAAPEATASACTRGNAASKSTSNINFLVLSIVAERRDQFDRLGHKSLFYSLQIYSLQSLQIGTHMSVERWHCKTW